jgi:hypothetical protein
LIFIDSCIDKALCAAAGSKKGNWKNVLDPPRSGRSGKVQAAVDQSERPLRLKISGGNLHDSQMMDAFVDWQNQLLSIIADKA